MAMTREQAAAAVAEATAERESIQTNLLDLDGSFGKQILAGATLTGESKLRWEAAATDLATLWEIFNAYAAVLDKAAELMAGPRRPSDRELAQVTTLLTGPSVELTRQKPLGRRGLTETGRSAYRGHVAALHHIVGQTSVQHPGHERPEEEFAPATTS